MHMASSETRRKGKTTIGMAENSSSKAVHQVEAEATLDSKASNLLISICAMPMTFSKSSSAAETHLPDFLTMKTTFSVVASDPRLLAVEAYLIACTRWANMAVASPSNVSRR